MEKIRLTKEAFEKVSKYTFNNFGINLTPAKQNLVENRLAKRLRHLDFDTFDEYVEYLFHPQGKAELDLLCDYLSTNKTYFYREPAHFTFLDQYFKSRKANHNTNIWSAACSSGDEVYTIAIAAEEAIRATNNRFQYNILGTDISSNMIELAKAGRYNAGRVNTLPKHLQLQYLKKLPDSAARDLYEVVPRIKQNAHFKKFNLIKDIPQLRGSFDVIMCRNVLIYFAEENKQHVLYQMIRKLRLGGYLILGHCEGMICKHPDLMQVQPSVFQRRHD